MPGGDCGRQGALRGQKGRAFPLEEAKQDSTDALAALHACQAFSLGLTALLMGLDVELVGE